MVHHLAVVDPAIVSMVIAMMCEVYRHPVSMTVVAREDLMLYFDIIHLLYAVIFSIIVRIHIGLWELRCRDLCWQENWSICRGWNVDGDNIGDFGRDSGR